MVDGRPSFVAASLVTVRYCIVTVCRRHHGCDGTVQYGTVFSTVPYAYWYRYVLLVQYSTVLSVCTRTYRYGTVPVILVLYNTTSYSKYCTVLPYTGTGTVRSSAETAGLIRIARELFLHKLLPAGEYYFADSGYRCPYSPSITEFDVPDHEREAMNRIMAYHETVNGRFKSWRILTDMFRNREELQSPS